MVASSPSVLRLELTETDLRHLCGAAFDRASSLQRDGHVISPAFDSNGLTATVRGVWRRLNQVRVGVKGTTPQPECSCGAGGYCPHVGAVLLAWARDRAAFVDLASPAAVRPYGKAPVLDPTQPLPSKSALAEIEECLQRFTANSLRELALERGVSYPKSRAKSDAIDLVAPILAAPGSIDAALARLDEDERRALDAVYLTAHDGLSLGPTIHAMDQALGGQQNHTPLGSLLRLGLLFEVEGYSHYRLPRAVAERLPWLDERCAALASAADADGPAVRQPVAPSFLRACSSFDIDELMSIVADALDRPGPGEPYPTVHVSAERPWRTGEGWVIDAAESDRNAARSGEGAIRRVELDHPVLPAPELDRLADRTGLPAPVVEFVVGMLAATGLVEGGKQLVARADRRRAYFALPASERRSALIRAWLGDRAWSELALILAPAGPFNLWLQVGYYFIPPTLRAEADALRQVVSQLVGRLEPGVWHDAAELIAAIERLAERPETNLMPRPTGPPTQRGATGWWLTREGASDQPLNFDSPSDQRDYLGVLVVALLAGPLAWLGLVEARLSAKGTLAFHANPAARGIFGAETGEEATPSGPEIQVQPDLTIRVPAGSARAETTAFLARVAEMTAHTSTELTYQITAERVAETFDEGVTGPEIVQFLMARSGGALPKKARATIEGWWEQFGSIHLYDEVTLIELGDDLLLDELRATSSLGASIVHAFSPRLIVVDPSAVDRLVAELTRLGHAPRVIEGT